MQIIQKKLSVSMPYQFLPDKSIQKTEILLFDIETTGFSPDISSIYLIGCCYYQNSSWNLIQFFADDYISEQTILQNFIDFAKKYKVMIHYNGNGFDIPYLKKKLIHYHMNFTFDSFLQIDLYKKIFPYKKMLSLTNLKQKTIEDFLNLPRVDSYSGGELIEVYVSYMKDKFGHKPAMQDDMEKLLLHNEEDVCNLIRITSIMAYCDMFEEQQPECTITVEEEQVIISLSLYNSLPVSVAWEIDNLSFTASESHAVLRISCVRDELKYFYSNYKDYYYLPAEDTAIHKSVAEFVDKNYRVKAKASTCYTKKSGTFLPQFHGGLTPSFRRDYKEKDSYVELTDKFLTDSEKCSEYASIVLQHLLHTINRR